jgi:anthranilate synthase component 2
MYDHIIISPGPGLPHESGKLNELIKAYYKSKKILGICLGLQAIVTSLGGSLKQLKNVHHGIEEDIFITDKKSSLFEGITDPFIAGRYHSWVADETNLPHCLSINCCDKDGIIMGIEHKEYPLFGLQFHPESIMTPQGGILMENFLKL